MSDLITRHLMAETSPDEEAALLEWRRADAANEAHYRRRKRLWALLASAPIPATRRPPLAVDLIEQAGVRRLRPYQESEVGRWGRLVRGRAWQARLGLVAALAACVTAVVVATSRPSPDSALGVAEFITGPHETNTLRLDDGTVVLLAPGSRLEFENGSPRVRQVSFEGVGYFAVAKDENRPFVVRTREGNAVVLGTRFELRTGGGQMRVVVEEGRVALESHGERKEVSTSQMGHAGADQPPTVVDVERVDELLEWVDDLLVFQSTPLSQVARELGDHYGVKIDIHDAELADRQVTAWLQEQSFDAALTAVCGAVGASCTIRPDGATMRLRGRVGRLTEHSPGHSRR